MQFHEIANIFPIMNEQEFAELKADIQEQGLLEPIITYEGKILDGRNRYMACNELDIEPEFVPYTGDTPLHYVVSKNLKRRHLTAGQKAFIGVEVEKKLAEIAKKQQGKRTDILTNGQNVNFIPIHARDQAAKIVNVKSGYLSDAKIIQQKAPDLAEKIKAGELTIPQANREIKKNDAINFRKEIAAKTADIPCENITNMRFQDAVIEPGSIDLILTDPPYGIEYKQSWIDLADFAERTLKPSGFLISYFGQINLPLYMSILNEKLNYYWTIALIHSGNKQLINARDIFCGWKPILIYQKPPFAKIPERIEDIIIGSGREKEMHDWQQGLSEIDPLIKAFTIEGEVILDPFAGSGTTIVAALQNNRKAMGFECEYDTYLIAKLRIEEYKNDR